MASDHPEYPRRSPKTAFRPVADEGCLVVVPGRAAVEVLNPIAGKIYEMLDGKHSEDDIVRSIVAEFDVSESDARRDLREFLDDLRRRDMLEVAGSNGVGEAGA